MAAVLPLIEAPLPASRGQQPWAARTDQASLEAIQWVAFVTMLVDHTGAFLMANAYWMRFIGRLSFPLFALVFAWRIAHLFWSDPKRDVEPMIWRLTLCALAAHLPWVMLGQQDLNIVFGFLGCLMICIFMDEERHRSRGLELGLKWVACSAAAHWLARHVDYNAAGVILVLAIYAHIRWNDTISAVIALAALAGVSLGFPIHAAVLALPLVLALYGRTRAPRLGRHLFYWLYPAHVWAVVAFAALTSA